MKFRVQPKPDISRLTSYIMLCHCLMCFSSCPHASVIYFMMVVIRPVCLMNIRCHGGFFLSLFTYVRTLLLLRHWFSQKRIIRWFETYQSTVLILFLWSWLRFSAPHHPSFHLPPEDIDETKFTSLWTRISKKGERIFDSRKNACKSWISRCWHIDMNMPSY